MSGSEASIIDRLKTVPSVQTWRGVYNRVIEDHPKLQIHPVPNNKATYLAFFETALARIPAVAATMEKRLDNSAAKANIYPSVPPLKTMVYQPPPNHQKTPSEEPSHDGAAFANEGTGPQRSLSKTPVTPQSPAVPPGQGNTERPLSPIPATPQRRAASLSEDNIERRLSPALDSPPAQAPESPNCAARESADSPAAKESGPRPKYSWNIMLFQQARFPDDGTSSLHLNKIRSPSFPIGQRRAELDDDMDSDGEMDPHWQAEYDSYMHSLAVASQEIISDTDMDSDTGSASDMELDMDTPIEETSHPFHHNQGNPNPHWYVKLFQAGERTTESYDNTRVDVVDIIEAISKHFDDAGAPLDLGLHEHDDQDDGDDSDHDEDDSLTLAINVQVRSPEHLRWISAGLIIPLDPNEEKENAMLPESMRKKYDLHFFGEPIKSLAPQNSYVDDLLAEYIEFPNLLLRFPTEKFIISSHPAERMNIATENSIPRVAKTNYMHWVATSDSEDETNYQPGPPSPADDATSTDYRLSPDSKRWLYHENANGPPAFNRKTPADEARFERAQRRFKTNLPMTIQLAPLTSKARPRKEDIVADTREVLDKLYPSSQYPIRTAITAKNNYPAKTLMDVGAFYYKVYNDGGPAEHPDEIKDYPSLQTRNAQDQKQRKSKGQPRKSIWRAAQIAQLVGGRGAGWYKQVLDGYKLMKQVQTKMTKDVLEHLLRQETQLLSGPDWLRFATRQAEVHITGFDHQMMKNNGSGSDTDE
ncbi:hypothetical protein C8J56DRAFT_1068953 [Mycena floridula]|nr:hypothetical protein C8J56DRAFT_1068953 [Mycena floridula]